MPKIFVKVKTNSSQEKIVEIDESNYIVYLRAKPHDGEANKVLIERLADYFKVAKTSIRIVRGIKSHDKVVEF
ncbi:DUF167 domain-containing protein [Candidatus Saccharibacteria bacterium]|nr:DUF167 domain-containing protein [Candidatus Saccharibacteria bacterium]